MKKTARNIIILLVVLLALGGAAFWLSSLPKEGDQEESSSSGLETEERISLFDKEDTDIKSVEVKNSSDQFTILPVQEGSDLSFTLEGYEDYDFNKSVLAANVRTMLGFKPLKELGSQDKLDAFGLGSDGTRVTVNYKDGGSDELVLGGASPETTGKYVLKDGQVYIISGVPDAFYSGKFSYFYTSVYTIPDMVDVTVDDEGETSETTTTDKLDSFTVSGAGFTDPISIKPSSRYLSGYGITEPVTAESGNTKFNELVTSLKSLEASSVVDAGVTDEKLEQYGLTEPDAKLSFSLNGVEHELSVSAKDSDGMRYMLADDNDLVYQVDNSAVANWAEVSVMDLRMSYVWIANIKDVKGLKVTLDGEEHSFDITREKNEEKSTDNSTEYDITKITDGAGNTVEYDDYQPFYQKLISVAVFSMDKAEYSGAPAVKLEYEYFGGGTDTVEYYEIPGMNRYAAVLNGGYNGQVRGTDIDAVLKLIP